MIIHELQVGLPFLPKGANYMFDDDTGLVWRVGNKGYPLRSGLANYLWLLKTEGDKYLKVVA